MMDVPSTHHYISGRLFGNDYLVGIFPFKAALKFDLPCFLVWFSPLPDRWGFQLHVRFIEFATTEEGIAKYLRQLECIVKENPMLWWLIREDPIFKHTPSPS